MSTPPIPDDGDLAPADPIDLGHLGRQTMGDVDLAAELLDLFARQSRRIIDDLAATPGATTAARRRRADLLHTLCGSARAVGAWDVASGAERLEHEERDAPPPNQVAAPGDAERPPAPGALDALDRSVASARAAIDHLRDRHAAAERG